MEEIKLIIEQYKRRLQTLKNSKGLDMISDTRLKTKASCYRSIISELERSLSNLLPYKYTSKDMDNAYDKGFEDGKADVFNQKLKEAIMNKSKNE